MPHPSQVHVDDHILRNQANGCFLCDLKARHTGPDRMCEDARFWDFYWDARRAFREKFPTGNFDKSFPTDTLRAFHVQGASVKDLMASHGAQ